MSPAKTFRRVPLALMMAAMLLSTGCGKKTTNVTNNYPSVPTPDTPAPEGETSPEDAKKLIETAYKEGYETGFDSKLEGVDPEERKNRRQARRKRRRRMRRRMRRVRRQEIAKILEAKYANRFEELVAQWEAANPGQEFTCEEDEQAPMTDGVDAEEAEESEAENAEEADTSEDAEETTGKNPGNLACWRKLCPAIDDLIRARHGRGGRGGYRTGFRDGYRAGRRDMKQKLNSASEATTKGEGWMGGPAALGDIDTTDMGVELPTEAVSQEELQTLMDEARANGQTAGEEAGDAAMEDQEDAKADRKEERKERMKERMQELRRKLRRRLPEKIADAADDCKVESTGDAAETPDDGIAGDDDCGCTGTAAEQADAQAAENDAQNETDLEIEADTAN